MDYLHSNGSFLVVKTLVHNFAQIGIYSFKVDSANSVSQVWIMYGSSRISQLWHKIGSYDQVYSSDNNYAEFLNILTVRDVSLLILRNPISALSHRKLKFSSHVHLPPRL